MEEIKGLDHLILTCIFLRFSLRNISKLLNIDNDVLTREIERLMLEGYVTKEGLLPIHVPILDRLYTFNRLMLTSKGYTLIDRDLVERVSMELETKRGLVTKVVAGVLDAAEYILRWLLIIIIALVLKVVGFISKVILIVWNIPKGIGGFAKRLTRKAKRKKKSTSA